MMQSVTARQGIEQFSARFNRVNVARLAERNPLQQIHPSLRGFDPAYDVERSL
jgi:hypothetical protein